MSFDLGVLVLSQVDFINELLLKSSLLHVLPKSVLPNVRFKQSPVCSKMKLYLIPFYQSPVLLRSGFSKMNSSKFLFTKVLTTKVRICWNVFYKSPFYQSPVLPKSSLLKNGILLNSVLTKSVPPLCRRLQKIRLRKGKLNCIC
jgi:hypothetical protein